MEEYKLCPYNAKYRIFSDGKIYSEYVYRFLKPTKKGGYLSIDLRIDGKPQSFKVHRLVAECFIPKKSELDIIVNHLDGDKFNNHYSNLEWTTHQENSIHAHKMGLVKKSKKEYTQQDKPLNGKQIDEIPGYLITDDGKVYSLKSNRYMKLIHNSDGYLNVNLNNESFSVHYLVIRAYIGPRPENMKINHKDSNKQNNHVNNLEYVTNQNNVQHCWDVGSLKHKKKAVHKIDPHTQQIIETYSSLAEASRKNNIKRYTSIAQVCHNYKHNNTYLGYIWKFTDDETPIIKISEKKNCIKVQQLDNEGNIINSYLSISEASKKCSIDERRIGEVCKGTRKEAGGFIWRKIISK